ncbi:MAG: glycine cleavage system aminomethyltransferase GcvT [Haloferacaceae archaeon]
MGRRSPLHGRHEARGARVTEFGGWTMPVRFDSIRAEHAAVRESVGKFDVSHMGELVVHGPDARALTGRLVTNDVGSLSSGEAVYGAVTDERGVMLDDTVVYRRPDADGDPDYLLIPNAGHDEEATARARRVRAAHGFDASVENATGRFGMVAVQGPEAPALVDDAVTDGTDTAALARFAATEAAVAGVDCLVANTGYTGETGRELVTPWAETGRVWDALDCPPCGLGARDTLRLEMGYLLAGEEFDPETEPRTPFEAGIGFAVDLATPFVGRDALVDATDPDDRLVGLRLLERGVPRHGYPVLVDGEPVGAVTSGTISPTLDDPIALAYLPRAHRDPGTRVAVEVRGDSVPARVVTTPFLER